MHMLRTFRARRWVVALLVASLLPLVAGPAKASVTSDTTGEYARWLRSQTSPSVASAAEADVERALSAALSTSPSSLDGFTAAFARAYRAQHPSVSLADLFALSTVSDVPLYRVLQQRAQQWGRAVAVSPLSWRMAPSSLSPGRTLFAGGLPASSLSMAFGSYDATRIQPPRFVPSLLLRHLSSANPRAP